MTEGLQELHRLLHKLDELLAQTQAPLASRLRPGLNTDEITATMRPLELELPLEAQIWWQWHDGVEHLAPGWRIPLHEQIGDSSLSLLQLGEAVREYQTNRKAALDLRLGDPEQWFQRMWFPMFRFNGHPAVIECGQAQEVSMPLRLIEWQDDMFEEVRAPSLTALVAVWVELLESGVWRWSGDKWESSLPHTHQKIRLAKLRHGGLYSQAT